MTFADTVTALAPTAWYRMGEASGSVMTDSVGTNDGAYYGPGLTLGVAGMVDDADTAVDFTTTSDFAEIPSDSTLGTYAAASMSIVVSVSSLAAKTVIENQDSHGIYLNADGSVTGFMANSSGAQAYMYGPAGAVSVDESVLLTLTWDGATARLYVGDVEQATGALSGSLRTANAYPTDLAYGTPMTLDEYAVYDKALAVADLTSLVAGVVGAAPPPTPVVSSSEYANYGYNYTGLGLVEFDPPIAPTPARVRREVTRRVHQSLPAPTLVNGRPT